MTAVALEGVETLQDFTQIRFKELRLTQVEFCRRFDFDQGLISKILNGVVRTISMETALKLAVGLEVEPLIIFQLAGHLEWEALANKAFESRFKQ